MLLQELVSFSDQLDLPPTLYVEAPVRYIINLDADGRFLGMVDTSDASSPRTRRGTPRLVPQVQRASGIRPLLLADKADYVLGYVGEGDKPERVAQCHTAFRASVATCETATGDPLVRAVRTFLEDIPADVAANADFNPSATMTFRVDGMFPIDLPSVQAFWAAENDRALKDAPIMQCVVCSQERPVLARLQAKIKGIRSGQTTGTSIISANANAFESYGLEESLIAPTCSDCGERFTKALNYLLANDQHCLRIGGAEFVVWTRENFAFDWFTVINQPSSAQGLALLESLKSGGWPASVDADRFFGCSLSGSGGRAVVRDWIDTTVGNAKQVVMQWFQRQTIVDSYGQQAAPLGIYALAAATVRDPRKDLAPPTPRVLIRAALAGAPLPRGLLQAAVRRCQLEQQVTRPRAALIKLAFSFTGPYDSQEDKLIALDTETLSPGYRCGRLLAVLEQAQRLAIPNLNQTIVDRFYGTASTAPRSVFSRLIQGARPHLAKLQRDRRGAAFALNRRLEEIMAGITSFPAVLSLEEQGLFALGYYHQRADDRAKALEAAARRRTGAAAEPEAELLDESAPESQKED